MDEQEHADSVLIKKDDLFFALVRLYLLIDDIDPGRDEEEPDTIVDGVDLAGLADLGEEDEDGPNDNPGHFQDLLFAGDESLAEYAEKTADEYIGLFALLSAPLEEDPVLKKEFVKYALLDHGVEIEFQTFDKKPKLTIVHSQKDDLLPPAPDKPGTT